MTEEEKFVSITSGTDIVVARVAGRLLAAQIGFESTDRVLIATAISELARSILEDAERGEILLTPVHRRGRRGIKVIARGKGPDITETDPAVQNGYSTSSLKRLGPPLSLRLGVLGVRRLMDELEVVSELGKGTTVTMKKWLK